LPAASHAASLGRVETYCEDEEEIATTPDLITDVAVHKVMVHDGHRLADALDDLRARSLTPTVMLADTLRFQ
jgi:hypothetical protein